MNLNQELVDNHDIVQGDFIDSYVNLTVKYSLGLKYAAYYCNNTRYVLMIDGDYSLNVKM